MYIFLHSSYFLTGYLYLVVTFYFSNTVEPLYYGHFGTLSLVLITEVSSIQRSFNTLQYYTGT